MATLAQETPRIAEPVNYLNVEHGWKSWLLTTDHKRIAVLYIILITLMFAVGGFFAVLFRINLLNPQGLFSATTYNRLFSMHGIIMVFFFLVPSIPATLANFLIPIMIGAKDLAFPRVNLLSWYLYIIGGVMMLHCMLTGGVDTGWTFYAPFATNFTNTKIVEAALATLQSAEAVAAAKPNTTRPATHTKSLLRTWAMVLLLVLSSAFIRRRPLGPRPIVSLSRL